MTSGKTICHANFREASGNDTHADESGNGHYIFIVENSKMRECRRATRRDRAAVAEDFVMLVVVAVCSLALRILIVMHACMRTSRIMPAHPPVERPPTPIPIVFGSQIAAFRF